MVIGSADDLPKAPSGPITFIEDMTESQLAQAVSVTRGHSYVCAFFFG